MESKRNQPLARDAMAYVLAGGRGSRLKELTDTRAKPAVYFGGKTRIIDFALSNAKQVQQTLERRAAVATTLAHALRHVLGAPLLAPAAGAPGATAVSRMRFSGNGKLELNVTDYLVQIDARDELVLAALPPSQHTPTAAATRPS